MEQLRRWKAAGAASEAAKAAVQRVCERRGVEDEGVWRMGSRGVGVGVSAGGEAGIEEREGDGEVDPGLFLIGDDEDEDEVDGVS